MGICPGWLWGIAPEGFGAKLTFIGKKSKIKDFKFTYFFIFLHHFTYRCQNLAVLVANFAAYDNKSLWPDAAGS